MAVTKAQVDIVVSGQLGLDRLEKSLETVHQRFSGLKTAILGLGLAALGASAIQTADQMMDLSDATGFTIARIKELRYALQEAGGESASVDRLIITFGNFVDTAAEGSLKAQSKFRSLGISLNDLANLDIEQLFNKAARAIGSIEDPTRRAAVAQELFGKAARGVNFEAFITQLDKATGSGQKYEESIRRAAELQGKFDEATANLKYIFLEAFEPALVKLNELVDKLKENKDTVETVATAFKLLGVIIGASLAVGGLLAFVRIIGTVGRGISALGGIFASLRASTSAAAGAFGGVGAAANSSAGKALLSFAAQSPLMRALRAVAIVVGTIGGAFTTAGLLFDDLGSKFANISARIVESIGKVAVEILNFPTDVLKYIGKLLGFDTSGIKGLGDAFDVVVEKARKSREEYEAQIRKQKEAEKKPTVKPPRPPGPVREVDTSALKAQKEAAKALGEEYDNLLKSRFATLKIERDSIGIGKLNTDIAKAQAEAEQKNIEIIDKLRVAKSKLTEEQRTPEVLKAYDAEIARLQKVLEGDKQAIANAYQLNRLKEQGDKLEGYRLDAAFNRETEIEKIRRQAANVLLPAIAQKYADIEEQIEGNVRAIIQQEQAELPRGQKLSQQRIDQIYATQRERVNELREAVLQLTQAEEQRTFNEFKLVRAQQLQTDLNKATDDYNKLFLTEQERIQYDIAAAARETAKAKVDEIEIARQQKLTDEERIRLQQQYYEEAIRGSDELAAKQIAIRNTTRSFEYGLRRAFIDYAENVGNAARKAEQLFTKSVQGMEDALVNFVKTGKFEWKGFVNSILEEILRSQIQSIIARTFGGIGGGRGTTSSLFAGFFANGGTIPGGQFGVVGERGPELVSGPATVTPMSSGSTVVNYNINAVDAMSFKQLVASDPSFIYAVTEQGRKSIPSTRR
jgi:lambda family phage tail tape measure protein